MGFASGAVAIEDFPDFSEPVLLLHPDFKAFGALHEAEDGQHKKNEPRHNRENDPDYSQNNAQDACGCPETSM